MMNGSVITRSHKLRETAAGLWVCMLAVMTLHYTPFVFFLWVSANLAEQHVMPLLHNQNFQNRQYAHSDVNHFFVCVQMYLCLFTLHWQPA